MKISEVIGKTVVYYDSTIARSNPEEFSRIEIGDKVKVVSSTVHGLTIELPTGKVCPLRKSNFLSSFCDENGNRILK